jgi:hypothetical protein
MEKSQEEVKMSIKRKIVMAILLAAFVAAPFTAAALRSIF